MTEKEKQKEEVLPETAGKESSVAVKKAPAKPKTETKAKPTSAPKTKPETKTEVAEAKPKEEAKPVVKTKPKKAVTEEITVTLKRSGIGRPKDQKRTLVGLGFKKVNQSRTLKDTPEIRGMIRKVSHLVEIK